MKDRSIPDTISEITNEISTKLWNNKTYWHGNCKTSFINLNKPVEVFADVGQIKK